ncbi:glycosyltransferase [Streptomyces sp. NPDC047917]|uniref:glycosyltransferase n=1 Tax=Streptomyces sp. NPDC047917 TaxID=3365491 RepID=UPI003716191F
MRHQNYLKRINRDNVSENIGEGSRIHANSLRHADEAPDSLLALQSEIGNAAVVQMLRRAGHSEVQGDTEPEPLRTKSAGIEQPVAQRSARETPDALPSGENLEESSWQIPFAKKSKGLSSDARKAIENAVDAAVREGLKAAAEGRPVPDINVVGYGNGSRLPGRGSQAEETGKERASAVETKFRDSLKERKNTLAPTVAPDHFSFDSRAASRDDPHPATRDEGRLAHINLRESNQSVLGDEGKDAVAKFVHAIWLGPEMDAYLESKKSGKSGGGLSGTARTNLEAWQGKAAASGWRLKVWSNASARDANQEFYGKLLDKGSVDIETVDAEIFDKDHSKAKEVMQTALGKKVFTLASDVARYGILYREGGVYVDVDIHPAKVELPRELTGDKEGVPFLAPELQDSKQYENVLEKEINRKRMDEGAAPLVAEDAEALKSVVDNQYGAGKLNNNFIVTPADSAFLRRLLEGLPEASDLKNLTTDSLKKNAAEKTGPNYIRNHIESHFKDKKSWPFGKRWADMFKERRIVVSKTHRQIWDRLQWITAESDITGEQRVSE